MNNINVRYGASLSLEVELNDAGATTATIYVGEEGSMPILTKTASFTDGLATIQLEPEDTEIPLGTYKYQINVDYDDGQLKKYPEVDCNGQGSELPEITILEALDVIEVS